MIGTGVVLAMKVEVRAHKMMLIAMMVLVVMMMVPMMVMMAKVMIMVLLVKVAMMKVGLCHCQDSGFAIGGLHWQEWSNEGQQRNGLCNHSLCG